MENNHSAIQEISDADILVSEESVSDTETTENTEATDNSDKEARREYEELIRTKYKKFYTEDTQKMINRRFRRYKEIEDRVTALENEKAQFEEMLRQEKEKSAKEAEERLISVIRSRHLRPGENGTAHAAIPQKKDVSSLTKSERAELAMRVSNGESIKI